MKHEVKRIVPDTESIVISEGAITEGHWVGMVHNHNVFLLVKVDRGWAFCGRYDPPLYFCEFRGNAIKAALHDHRMVYASHSLQALVALLIP